MERVNSNDLINATTSGGDDLLAQDDLQDRSLEAYTVVLSAAAHVLSTVFGGCSSVAVVIAITARRNINKYSYTLVLALFLTCCSLNFVWSPLEVVDLVMFHHTQKHLLEGYVAIKTYLYLFLILLIGFILVFLSTEGVVRLKTCFGKCMRKLWPLTSTVIAFALSSLLTVMFIVKCMQYEDVGKFSYIFLQEDVRSLFLALTALVFCLVTAILVILLVLILNEAVYCEDGRPHLRQKKIKLAVPEFLISQSNACADNDGGFEPSQSGTPSPSTPKLLMVGDPETASIKGEDTCPISELPSPMAKPMGNRLGINMAQVLGRRRHTICQISDSSSAASTPADPITKAKQYNYVRKFSVDISALQAQLQNPKIFKDAPFQSDIDLCKKQSADKPQAPSLILPLKPLPGKLDDSEGATESEKVGAESCSGGVNIVTPPVIMVSNDDAPPMAEESDFPNEINSSESFHEQMKPNASTGNAVPKPTSLVFKESTEDHISAPTLESALSDPSDAESEGRKMARLTFLLSLSFVLNMLPVLVTEILQNRLSPHAYINISTCTVAVSTIQTIVYPHLIACSDETVHRAVHKLKKRLKQICSCHGDTDAHSQVEDSSSTSQL